MQKKGKYGKLFLLKFLFFRTICWTSPFCFQVVIYSTRANRLEGEIMKLVGLSSSNRTLSAHQQLASDLLFLFPTCSRFLENLLKKGDVFFISSILFDDNLIKKRREKAARDDFSVSKDAFPIQKGKHQRPQNSKLVCERDSR